MTIFQKLQVLRYADELLAKCLKPKRGKAGRSGAFAKKCARGINVQRMCEIKFGDMLGKAKVCVLRKAAAAQQWGKLTEAQQKTMYQLSDSVKVSLGLEDQVKGYKALGQTQMQKILDSGSLNRWNVPGTVLQETFPDM